MRRRRRNPGGVIGWASAHPWMTFFLASAAIGAVATVLGPRPEAAPAPAPADPFGKLPALPAGLPTVVTDLIPTPGAGDTVFVPGVFDS